MTDLLDRHRAGERPRIDPRIARRWIDARRQEGRRRLHVLIAAGAVVAAVVVAVGSLYTPLFRVRHVRITVSGAMAPPVVARLSGVTDRTQTIDVHPGAVAARLDSDPWLGHARVTRHWPGTVTISVAVRAPLAVVALAPPGGGGPAGWAEVDATGRVLADVATRPAGLPQLQIPTPAPAPGSWLAAAPGPGAPPGAPPGALVDMAAAMDGPDVPSGPGAALAFLDALPPLLRADVLSVSARRRAGLSLVLSPPRLAAGTVTVVLGDGSELQSKVTALLTVLQDGELAGVGALDLSVPDRPTTAASLAALTPASLAPASPDGAAPPAAPGPSAPSRP